MNIYIDEAGSFVKPKENKYAVSVVGALILPENKTRIIFSKFKALKNRWGFKDEEVKGSKLNETQINCVISILETYNVMFEAIAIDTNIEEDSDVTVHKLARANKMISCITKEFNDTLISNLHRTKEEIESLPNQLYIQASLTTELLQQVFQKTMLNYSLRKPKELENFNWFVDAKNANITTVEKVWKSLVLPLAQSQSFDKPLAMIREGNYDYFFKNRKSGDIPNYLEEYVGDKDPNDFFELNSVYSNIEFKNSEDSLGIQLADILTTAMRRAMVGNLQKSAWKNFEKILVMTSKQSITLMNMSEDVNFDKYKVPPPYFDVIEYLNKASKEL